MQSLLFCFLAQSRLTVHDLRMIGLQVRSSVAVKDLEFYRQWNDEFGSFAFESHEGD
jgi:hypothetical protein